MTRSPASSFDTLRTWNGSQDRAFEEIGYQLLKGDVPEGSTAIRTGNPDGGVEWYVILANGDEHGWQAKHVHGIDALLTAMTKSVKTVVVERPKLRKLTFVISWNLATGTSGNEKKSQRQKYEDKVAAWKKNIKGAADIDFALIQGSELLDKLVLPEHRGREWFWWQEPVFDAKWLRVRLDEQADAAGDKYRPDLQVDLPIQLDVDGLGFSDVILDEFNRLRKRLVDACRELRLTPAGDSPGAELYKTIAKSSDALAGTLDGTHLQPFNADAQLNPAEMAIASLLAAVDAAADFEYERERNWYDARRENPDGAGPQPKAETRHYPIHRVRTAASELQRWIESSPANTLRKRLYFLSGVAGSGKTHLLLDAASRALAEGRPAVVLFGARFGKGDLWASICDQLGLKNVGKDVLLGAMDAAGQSASVTSRRFLILIDALNETTPPDFWHTHLPELRAAIKPWPHIALAVSCRDTYVDVVDDGEERKHYEFVKHPGFADREIEATQKYFDHYGLEAPRIPLLTPEFTVPLFLRLYCESLVDEGDAAIAVGHESRLQIFERFLRTKYKRIARRYRTSSTSHEQQYLESRVQRVLDGLLDEMSRTGREGMSVARASEIASAFLDNSSENAARMIGVMQDEGVLTNELLYIGGGKSENGVRITFQAFSDFLILKRRLAGVADPANDPVFIEWLAETCSWGVQEAAMTALPEIYGVEVIDLLGVESSDLNERPDRRNDPERNRRFSQAHYLYGMFLRTLPYRDGAAVRQRTVELMNDSMRTVSDFELFQTMFAISPQPDNALNAEALHRYLAAMPMPKRDAFFGFAMYDSMFDEAEPLARLARWAANGPYPAYDSKIIELSCIPLMWLLSSPNRFMRDWVTKALVQLLHGHLDVVRLLVERFWQVDDPYVVQRVIVIAHACLMRSQAKDSGSASELVAVVRDLVFARPMRPDELMLDAARGIVQWGVAQQLFPDTTLDVMKRPYGFKIPGNPPTADKLEEQYGWREAQPREASYSIIHSSLFSLGDFGRYVVESRIDDFSRFRYGQPYPEDEPEPETGINKAGWKRFERSLTGEQIRMHNVALAQHRASDDPLAELDLKEFSSSLTPGQWELFQKAFQRSRKRRTRQDDRYPGERARRWVFMRTLSLGWKPELFGQQDDFLNRRDNGRSAHKAERWGKKYQWMAFHELFARIADNYQPLRGYSDSAPYEGLHQTYCRDIDATLPPIDYREFAEEKGETASTWKPSPIRFTKLPGLPLSFVSYGGSVQEFLADHKTEPLPDRVAYATDQDGHTWIPLCWYERQMSPKSLLGSDDKRFDQTHSFVTWFAKSADAVPAVERLAQARRDDRIHFVDINGHIDCCYFGELGSSNSCSHRRAEWSTMELGDRSVEMVAATEDYSWEGNVLDCSIGDTVSASLPSAFMQERSSLLLNIAGPSWTTDDGETVIAYVDGPSTERQHGLLVRADWLNTFLKEHDLVLLASAWFERRLLDNSRTWRHPYTEGWIGAAWFADGNRFSHVDLIRGEFPTGDD